MKERVAYIDGLRGIAVLAVVLFHAGVHSPALAANPRSAIALLLRQGSHGVDLFFILSGFCLSYPVLSRVRSFGAARFDVAAFAARRLVRIIPPYYAAIVLFAGLAFVLLRANVSLPEPIDVHALSAAGILKQALFLDGDHRFLDASFWTLAIEFRWYFVFPVLLWVWAAYPRAFVAIAVVAMIGAATAIQSLDLFFLPLFMLGIVAAELHARDAAQARLAVPASIAAVAIAAVSTANGGWYFLERGPLWGVAMFCIVVTAGSMPLMRTALSAKVLVAAGTASYGIYLVHEPIVALIERSAQGAGTLGAYLLAVGGALAAGIVFSFIAERPFVNSALRRKLLLVLQPALRFGFQRLGLQTDMELARARADETMAA